MKKLVCLFIFFISFSTSFAQISDKNSNTIDVQGYAKLLVTPDAYSAQILIQEEEQKVGYTTIGKLSIDSVKANLFLNLKKFGIDEKEAKILATSSKEIGQYPNYLLNIAYEVRLKSREVATMLVNEMRFTGLKGVTIKRIYTQAHKDALADSLYNAAIADAKKLAIALAKKTNKTLGDIQSIEARNNTFATLGMYADAGTEYYNSYPYNKYEMDYQDKYATCSVRIVFEAK